MLKAIHVLVGSSSGLVSHGFKPTHHGSCRLSLISVSISRFGTGNCLVLHASSGRENFSSRRCCLRPIQKSFTHSDSNPDAFSSSSLSSSLSTPSSVAFHSAGSVCKIKFCQWCGGPTKHEIPDGEEKMRAICTLCGKIAYENPKMLNKCRLWVASSSMKTRYYYASGKFNHHMVFGLFLLVIWKWENQLQKELSEKHWRRQMPKLKSSHLLCN